MIVRKQVFRAVNKFNFMDPKVQTIFSDPDSVFQRG
jgi:hypothetical protein